MQVSTPIHYINQLDPTDQQNLDTLFNMLANQSYISLLFNRPKLEKLHCKLEHVHPLNFLEAAKEQPSLRNNIKKLSSKGDLVWNKFRDHFVEQMVTLNEQGSIKPHIQTFAIKAELNQAQVREYVDRNDMLNLFSYTINH